MASEKMKCWTPQSKPEIILLILLIFFVLAAITLAVVFTVFELTHPKNDGNKEMSKDNEMSSSPSICDTYTCIQSASNLLHNMNLSVNPCENFYDFVCGQFLARTNTNQEPTGGVFDIKKLHKAAIREILQKPLEKSDPEYLVTIKNFHLSCLNITRVEELKESPFFNALVNLGGWPVLHFKDWNEQDFDWEDAFFAFRKEGISTNFIMEITTKPENNSFYILALKPGIISIPDQNQLISGQNHEYNIKYFNFMIKTLLLFGADETQARSAMKSVLDMEISLAKKLTSIEEQNQNLTENDQKMTIKELQRLEPNIRWLQFIRKLDSSLENITEDLTILVPSKDYINFIATLMTKTNKRNVANFIKWQMAKSAILNLDSRFQELYMDLTGSKIYRQEYCESLTTRSFSLGIGALYVQRYFNKETKPLVIEILQNIVQEFQTASKRLDWLDEKSSVEMQNKLSRMKYSVGYFTNSLNNKMISEYYKTLNISKNELYLNARRVNKFTQEKLLDKLNHQPEDLRWIHFTEKCIKVERNYDEAGNSFELLPGLLTSGIFNSQRPRYMNYGSLGFFIAHEIVHGFDEDGSEYDSRGNLRKWWQPETAEKFQEKTQCLVDHYKKFVDEKTNTSNNGNLTVRENVADNGGFKLSYQAYQNWVKNNGEEMRLPGFNRTNNQLFWISAVNPLCVAEEPVEKRRLPFFYRVFGSLSNLEEFANDFKCEVNTPMNPSSKCSVW